ncbi:ferritin-like domain-containing protein [Ramlibacter aurantiacus]|nr:PA2169 family four-helix-bundle protein [Ramlibacter aurantiacus]
MNEGDRDDTIKLVKELVETCKDGEYGFQQCADRTDRAILKTVFMQRAEECRRGASELEQQLRQMGADADVGGSAMGSVHRGWVSVRTAMSSHDDKVVLEEAERGEDNALARYRKALQKPMPAHLRQVIQHQCDGVQRNHDQIKRLRDEARARG